MVAVQASFFDGISFLPSNAFINVDFPELIVATTLIGNIELLILLNALINLGSLKSSTGPSCKSLKTDTILSLISSSDLPSENCSLRFLIFPSCLACVNASSKSSQSNGIPWNSISKSTVFNSSTSISGNFPTHSCNLLPLTTLYRILSSSIFFPFTLICVSIRYGLYFTYTCVIILSSIYSLVFLLKIIFSTYASPHVFNNCLLSSSSSLICISGNNFL